jgi:O-antigen/teichoic acid export membrane protein
MPTSHWAARVGRSAAFSIVAEVLARAANTIFFILLAWYIGEAEAGRYSLGFVFSALLLPFALGGFDQLLIREAARDHVLAPRLLGNLLIVRAAGLVLCYLGLVVWLAVDRGYDPQTRLVVAILAATCIPEGLIDLYQGYLFAFERAGYITLIGAATGALKLIAGLIALALGSGAVGAGSVVLVTSLASLVLHGWAVSRRIGPPSWRLDRQLWRRYQTPAIVFCLIAICMTLEGVQDTLLLSRLYGPAAVGIYAAAANLISILNILPQGLRQAILPVMAQLYTQSHDLALRLVGQSLRLVVVLTLLIGLSATLVGDYGLQLLYNGRFVGAAPVLITLIWAFVFATCAIPNARLIVVAGRQNVFVPVHVVSMLLNLGLNLALQPQLGAQGAAWARLASSALVCLFGMIYVQLRIQRWPIASQVRGPLAAVAAALICAAALQVFQLPPLVLLGVSWVVYGTGLLSLRVFNLEDLRRLREFVRRRAAVDLT